MLSFGIEAALAFSIAFWSARFPAGSAPPSFAATMIARDSFEKSLPRFASAAPFLCLIDDHLLCPDTSTPRNDSPWAGGTYRFPRNRLPWSAVADRPLEAPEGLVDPVEAHQTQDRGRLAAGDHEPVQPVELPRLAHLDDLRAKPAQHRRVLAKVPL